MKILILKTAWVLDISGWQYLLHCTAQFTRQADTASLKIHYVTEGKRDKQRALHATLTRTLLHTLLQWA